MKCLRSGEQLRLDQMVPSSESLATKDYSASGYSSRAGEIEQKPDIGNIEEAESSLRESGSLNYEVRSLFHFAQRSLRHVNISLSEFFKFKLLLPFISHSFFQIYFSYYLFFLVFHHPSHRLSFYLLLEATI